MPIPDPKKIWPKLEQAGINEVRKRLAMGVYAKNKIPVIEEWLRQRKQEGDAISTIPSLQSKDIWSDIGKDYDLTKRAFGKKINFVKDNFRRKIIFRDVEQAYVLANNGFSKPAVILAGSVIEELLRQYLKYKNVKPKKDKFDEYIKACEDKGLLKSAIYRLTDSIRHFRNLVHLEREKSAKHTISKPTAKGAVSSIFTVANDFE